MQLNGYSVKYNLRRAFYTKHNNTFIRFSASNILALAASSFFLRFAYE